MLEMSDSDGEAGPAQI